jgi:hypothetical protein
MPWRSGSMAQRDGDESMGSFEKKEQAMPALFMSRQSGSKSRSAAWGAARSITCLSAVLFSVVLLGAVLIGADASIAQAARTAKAGVGSVISQPAVHYDTSPPLRLLRPPRNTLPSRSYPALPTPPVPSTYAPAPPAPPAPSSVAEPGVQLLSPLIPESTNFEGAPIGPTTPLPADPSGAAGSNDQYMEVVNKLIAVYLKSTGAALLGPEPTNTLWATFGGECEKQNSGDGTVLFDTLKQRWVVQQFAILESQSRYLDCVAVSETSDATSRWHRYSFSYGSFPDYPKMGVWPDAYYISYNLYSGNTFLGYEVCAFDRAKMLNGEAATQQCFTGPNAQSGSSLLPATIDGSTAPPTGALEWFVALSPNSAEKLLYFKFHVDWTTPANSKLNGPSNLTVNQYSQACRGKACIPQLGTNQKLDSLGDRLMYRLAYRKFSGHEAMVVTHSVLVGEPSALLIGLRWYELRPSGESLTVFQQGTYAPEGPSRWMGSIAQHKTSDMALGYSASGSSMYPQIRYTGRLVTDTSGTMPQGEATLFAGSGSQTQSERWGDYTQMSSDPADECTFWYVNEYLPASGNDNWRTRIGSFKFPSC